jgi:uncharacterized membrane protein YphA (DoxX/SURF4 family)
MFAAEFRSGWEAPAHRLLLVVLCGAFIQGGLVKLADFAAAEAEMVHFGVPFPTLSATAAIVTELVAPVLIVLGLFRGLACLWLAGFTLFATLVANRFWELPAGPDRFVSAAGLFEHLGLVAAFCLVALFDRWSPR